MFKLIVLVSGNGSNLQYLIDNFNKNPKSNIKITNVISNRKSAYALQRAQENDIKNCYIPYIRKNQTREQYDQLLSSYIETLEYDLIVCAGWMHILGPNFLKTHKRIINLHPALPNTYKGVDCIRKTFEGFKKGQVNEGGVMIHWVIPEIDSGKVIYSQSIPLKNSIYEFANFDVYEENIKKIEKESLLYSINLIHKLGLKPEE